MNRIFIKPVRKVIFYFKFLQEDKYGCHYQLKRKLQHFNS